MYKIAIDKKVDKQFSKIKKKDKKQFEFIKKKVKQILENPHLGKPLKKPLDGFWRVHTKEPFVLIYLIKGNEIHLVKYGHHDNIYKKTIEM